MYYRKTVRQSCLPTRMLPLVASDFSGILYSVV